MGPDGKTQYAKPNKFLMFYLYYRKDILKAAGVGVPKTQQEFVDAAKALAASAPGKQFAFNLRAGNGGWDQWAAFLVAGGAKFIDDSGKVVLNSPEALKSSCTCRLIRGLPREPLTWLRAGRSSRSSRPA